MNVSTIANVTTTQLGTSCSFDSPGLARDEPTPGQRSQGDSTPIGVELFLRKHSYSEVFNGGLRLESATPMALFNTHHTLTQGSLRYRLATLNYQKRNTSGVETYIL